MQGNRLMLIIAVVAGVAATGLAFVYINSAAGEHETEETISVLFVARDLPANHALDPDTDLRAENIGIMSSPGIARGGVKAEEHDALRGRQISGPLMAGVPLMYSHLASILDIELGPGMRAMTISVSSDGALAGLLVPDDRVDIIVSFEASAPQDQSGAPLAYDPANPQSMLGALLAQATAQTTDPARWEAREVLSDVRVIAVGDRLHLSRQQLVMGSSGDFGPSDAGAVTIEVTPEQALELIRATAGGANPLTLLLRPTRSASARTDEATIEEEEP